MQLGRKTEEEKQQREAQKQAERELKAREKLRRSFYGSPVGEARVAFEAGARIFQYETNVKSTKSVVRPILLGSSAMGKETFGSRLGRGPVDTLNAVANEGWEIVNGSFVFVETGQQSRDKFMASGQQVAVSGTVIGYYVFKRNEELKVRGQDPWDVSEEEAVALADQVDE